MGEKVEEAGDKAKKLLRGRLSSRSKPEYGNRDIAVDNQPTGTLLRQRIDLLSNCRLTDRSQNQPGAPAENRTRT